jgi:hypothetical protein
MQRAWILLEHRACRARAALRFRRYALKFFAADLRVGHVQRISNLLTILIGTTDELPGPPDLTTTTPSSGRAYKRSRSQRCGTGGELLRRLPR